MKDREPYTEPWVENIMKLGTDFGVMVLQSRISRASRTRKEESFLKYLEWMWLHRHADNTCYWCSEKVFSTATKFIPVPYGDPRKFLYIFATRSRVLL